MTETNSMGRPAEQEKDLLEPSNDPDTETAEPDFDLDEDAADGADLDSGETE